MNILLFRNIKNLLNLTKQFLLCPSLNDLVYEQQIQLLGPQIYSTLQITNPLLMGNGTGKVLIIGYGIESVRYSTVSLFNGFTGTTLDKMLPYQVTSCLLFIVTGFKNRASKMCTWPSSDDINYMLHLHKQQLF